MDLGAEEVLDLMRRAGIPRTREDYIDVAWGDPLPDPWLPEHESQLPADLQDWSRFEMVDGSSELAEKKYNPNQPRDPGGEGGGQWISGGGGGADAAATADSASDKPAQALLAKNHDATLTVEKLYERISKEHQELLRAAVAESVGKPMTNAPVSEGGYKQPDGTYTPERQALHNKIIDELFSPDKVAAATPAPTERPTLILLGGRPAAGKTSTLAKSVGEGYFYLSADTIQENLPGYSGTLANLYNQEAQDISFQAEMRARNAGLNILYDATLKTGYSAHERVAAYQAAGYQIDGYFVHTTPEESAVRSVDRFTKHGRLVPPEVSFNSRTNEQTFDSLIPKFRHWEVHDNNGSKPVKVASGDNEVRVTGGEQAAKDQKKKWIASSRLTSLDQVYASAEANKKILDAVSPMVAKESGATFRPGSIKGRERATKKMNAGRGPAGVTDIVRCSFYVSSPEQANKVSAALAKHFQMTDEGWKVTDLGYFDRAVNVRFKNDQIGEVLLLPPEVSWAKSDAGGGGHKMYVESRELPDGDPRKLELENRSRALYGKVLEDLPKAWRKAVLGKAGS